LLQPGLPTRHGLSLAQRNLDPGEGERYCLYNNKRLSLIIVKFKDI
jgi:hypothetical protein